MPLCNVATPAQTQRPCGGETTRVNRCATLVDSTSNCTESIDHRRKRTRAFDPGSVDSYFDDLNKMTLGVCYNIELVLLHRKRKPKNANGTKEPRKQSKAKPPVQSTPARASEQQPVRKIMMLLNSLQIQSAGELPVRDKKRWRQREDGDGAEPRPGTRDAPLQHQAQSAG